MDIDEESVPDEKKPDHLFNYHRGKLVLGLLLMDINDAVREGDGQRLMTLYRIVLPIYYVNGCTKYVYTTLLLLVKLKAILSEAQAFCLTWNRFCNKHGRKARNIPLDLRLEQLNNLLKGFLKSLGANLKEKNAQRIARSLQALESILDALDEDCKLNSQTRVRKSKDPEETVAQIVKDLTEIDAFLKVPGREGHLSFAEFRSGVIGRVDYSKFYKSIKDKIELWKTKYES